MTFMTKLGATALAALVSQGALAAELNLMISDTDGKAAVVEDFATAIRK